MLFIIASFTHSFLYVKLSWLLREEISTEHKADHKSLEVPIKASQATMSQEPHSLLKWPIKEQICGYCIYVTVILW